MDDPPDMSNPMRASAERPLDTAYRMSQSIDQPVYPVCAEILWPTAPPELDYLPPVKNRSLTNLGSIRKRSGTLKKRNSSKAASMHEAYQEQAFAKDSLSSAHSSTTSLTLSKNMSQSSLQSRTPSHGYSLDLLSTLMPREGGYAVAAQIGHGGSPTAEDRRSYPTSPPNSYRGPRGPAARSSGMRWNVESEEYYAPPSIGSPGGRLSPATTVSSLGDEYDIPVSQYTAAPVAPSPLSQQTTDFEAPSPTQARARIPAAPPVMPVGLNAPVAETSANPPARKKTKKEIKAEEKAAKAEAKRAAQAKAEADAKAKVEAKAAAARKERELKLEAAKSAAEAKAKATRDAAQAKADAATRKEEEKKTRSKLVKSIPSLRRRSQVISPSDAAKALAGETPSVATSTPSSRVPSSVSATNAAALAAPVVIPQRSTSAPAPSQAPVQPAVQAPVATSPPPVHSNQPPAQTSGAPVNNTTAPGHASTPVRPPQSAGVPVVAAATAAAAAHIRGSGPVRPPVPSSAIPPAQVPGQFQQTAPVRPPVPGPIGAAAPMRPLQAQMQAPSQAPVRSSVPAPAQAPIRHPEQASMQASVRPPAPAQAQAPVPPTAQAPTQAPVQPTVRAPLQAQVQAQPMRQTGPPSVTPGMPNGHMVQPPLSAQIPAQNRPVTPPRPTGPPQLQPFIPRSGAGLQQAGPGSVQQHPRPAAPVQQLKAQGSVPPQGVRPPVPVVQSQNSMVAQKPATPERPPAPIAKHSPQKAAPAPIAKSPPKAVPFKAALAPPAPNAPPARPPSRNTSTPSSVSTVRPSNASNASQTSASRKGGLFSSLKKRFSISALDSTPTSISKPRPSSVAVASSNRGEKDLPRVPPAPVVTAATPPPPPQMSRPAPTMNGHLPPPIVVPPRGSSLATSSPLSPIVSNPDPMNEFRDSTSLSNPSSVVVTPTASMAATSAGSLFDIRPSAPIRERSDSATSASAQTTDNDFDKNAASNTLPTPAVAAH